MVKNSKSLKTIRISGHVKQRNVDIVPLSVYWYPVFGEKAKIGIT